MDNIIKKNYFISYVIKEKLGFLDWKERYSAILNARYSDSLYWLKFAFG